LEHRALKRKHGGKPRKPGPGKHPADASPGRPRPAPDAPPSVADGPPRPSGKRPFAAGPRFRPRPPGEPTRFEPESFNARRPGPGAPSGPPGPGRPRTPWDRPTPPDGARTNGDRAVEDDAFVARGKRPPGAPWPRPRREGPVHPAEADLDDVVYGLHAAEEALVGGERLLSLHVAAEREAEPTMQALVRRARDAGVHVRSEPRGFFTRFPMRAHQGVVARCAPFPYVTLAEAISARRPGEPALVVVLDHVTDPHNLGAIVRSAECAGATAIVLPERRAAGVNATVRKAAAGAVTHLPIARVANVAQALRKLREAGAWIVGASVGPEAVPYTTVDLSPDVALVIGAEGDGLSLVAANACDVLATIPLHGKVASLNASVAAAVLLFETRRQREARTRVR